MEYSALSTHSSIGPRGPRPAAWERFLPLFYDRFPAENVTPAIAELAGRWRQEYRVRGQTLSTADTLIAATAFRAGRCPVTRNVKHYPMPELQRYRGL